MTPWLGARPPATVSLVAGASADEGLSALLPERERLHTDAMTTISISERTEQPSAVVRERVRMDELPAFFSRAFHDTMAALTAQGRHPAGPPFGKYYGMPTDTVDVEAGFPASQPIEPSGSVVPGVLPGGRIVEAIHVGSYDTLQEAYADVQRYFRDHDLTPGEAMWESYLSDPGAEPDPARWRTQISWPVADDPHAPTSTR